MNILDTIPKDRLITGLALLGGVLIIGLIDNFFLIWLTLGAVYLLAFKEAMNLFDIKNNNLLYFAVAIWLIAAIFSQGDDIFV